MVRASASQTGNRLPPCVTPAKAASAHLLRQQLPARVEPHAQPVAALAAAGGQTVGEVVDGRPHLGTGFATGHHTTTGLVLPSAPAPVQRTRVELAFSGSRLTKRP